MDTRDLDARWRGTEPDRHLTWSTILEGRSFFEAAQRIFDLRTAKRVLEIGPGYGRLLGGLRELGLTPDFYLGVDLSEARVRRLSEELGSADVKFMAGDARTVDLSAFAPFDLMISSATFEHISPTFGAALIHLRQFLTGRAVLDLIDGGDDGSGVSRRKVLVRLYSPVEIVSTLQVCGFRCEGLVRFDMATTEFEIEPSRLERREGLSMQDNKTALVHRFMVVGET
ncbi:MAG: class I SAM-dependent methyltransferase [Rhodospirillales bacterium]|nr:class I SAM-dependent methyltransferase [Rhodospirillales bacterium]MDH3969964.1 class I SAM-dependent methyltransferase [Rhodospirillales bacterium]